MGDFYGHHSASTPNLNIRRGSPESDGSASKYYAKTLERDRQEMASNLNGLGVSPYTSANAKFLNAKKGVLRHGDHR